MAAWTRQGIRLDIALAVAFEVAVLALKRAEAEAERSAARDFNRRLWRVAASLAPSAPLAEDRDGLAAASGKAQSAAVAADELCALNTQFARALAGRAATQGALRQILDEWRTARITTDIEFGHWLVARLESLATASFHHPMAA